MKITKPTEYPFDALATVVRAVANWYDTHRGDTLDRSLTVEWEYKADDWGPLTFAYDPAAQKSKV